MAIERVQIRYSQVNKIYCTGANGVGILRDAIESWENVEILIVAEVVNRRLLTW